MNSAIFSGTVEHWRLAPSGHMFTYPADFLALDLAELPELDRTIAGFGHNRVRPCAIHDGDYLEPTAAPVAAKLRAHLAAAGVRAEPARVLLITAARHWNYVFNPVSFHLALNAAGQPFAAVAEVNNTFGDRHLYVLPSLQPGEISGEWLAETDKVFHVSPFNDMRGRYRFSFRCSPDAVDVRVDLARGGQTFFRARLAGRGVPLTTRALWCQLALHPLRAALTVPRIVAQAARLRYARKLPVHARPEPQHPLTIIRAPPRPWERWAQQALLAHLVRIANGDLSVTLPDGTTRRFGAPGTHPAVRLDVRRYSAFTRLLLGGDVGLGEAYVAGDLACDDPTALLELLVANRDALADGNFATALLGRVANVARHLRRPNSRRQSKRNIHAHYDLGNAFYQLFLDPTLSYSCAVFAADTPTLESAQLRKIHALIDKARLSSHHHVLEIGCGWGTFAIEAARRTGCRVTAITVSEEQRRLAAERVRAAGLSDRIEIHFCDYRDMRGRFDRIVSVEMIEAVGHRYFETFFRCCDRLLAPDGLVVLQVITIPDQRYHAYRRGCDWIQKHIFPGGHLPSMGALNAAMSRASALHVEHLENIGPHYATTLRHWRSRFDGAEDRVRTLGFDETFIRKWRYYLAYCEAAFASRTLDTLHLVLTRPNNRELDLAPRAISKPRDVQPPAAVAAMAGGSA